MKRMILPILTSCLIASSVHAIPLTWNFSGTTESDSTYNGSSIGGRAFELRIFLDTNLVGMKFPDLADVFFFGPHQGEIEIETLGVLPLDMFEDVQYFAPGGLVTGVQFNQPAFNGIQFASPISSNSLHLTPIAPTAPNSFNTPDMLFGPNGLFVSGEVATFSATTTTVPEAGSTALLLTSALVTLGFLRRRI